MPGTSWSAETGNIFGFNSELISLCPFMSCVLLLGFSFLSLKKCYVPLSLSILFIWSVLRDNWFFRNFPKTPVCEINDANHSNVVLCFIDNVNLNRARRTNVTDINAQQYIMVMFSVHCTVSFYFPNRRQANRPKGVTGLRHEMCIGLYALSQKQKPPVINQSKSFICYLSFNEMRSNVGQNV